jgi:hypothetical protein
LRLVLAILLLLSSFAHANLYIAEFMASNAGILLDEDGDSSDWIELYNSGQNIELLNGLFLTDTTNNLAKWPLPAIELAADQSIVIFASGKDRRDPADELHTNFKLEASGEFLGLVDASGQIVHAFSPAFPLQYAEVSYGLGTERIDSVLVDSNALLRSFVPTNSALSNLWTITGFDDTNWANGRLGVGFDRLGVYPDLIQHDLEAVMYNQQLNALLRIPFLVSDPSAIDRLRLEVLVDDGYAAWINGVEVIRENLAGPDGGGDRLVSYLAGTGAGGGVIDLQEVEVSRGGYRYTYATNELIGITLTQFSGSSGSNVTLPTGLPVPASGDRHLLLDGDFNLNTGIINPGYAASAPVSGPTASTPGFAIQFDRPVVNRAGDDVLFFELQTSANPPGGDAFHVMPLTGIGVNGLRAITISSYDIQYGEAQTLDGFTLYRAPTTPGSLAEMETLAYASPSNLSGFRALAVGIDLSELGYAPGTSADGLFFQAADSGSTVDPVLIAGLPEPPSDSPFVHRQPANLERDPVDVLAGRQVDLSAFKDGLFAGTNVLAIQVANARLDDDELMFRGRLLAGDEQLVPGLHQYFLQSTPGASNPSGAAIPGPVISAVSENPPRPAFTNDLPIAARVRSTQESVDHVELVYRVMFGPEIVLPMSANGDIWSGDIPASAYAPGQMVRWFVRAVDTEGASSRKPLFTDPFDSPAYFGTVVQTNLGSQVEVLHRFVENAGLVDTDPGTRCSIFFNGAFYDNVNVRIRGRGSRSWPKKSHKLDFNPGHDFRWHPAYPRTDEINLNSTYSDPSYLRNLLSFETWDLAGAKSPVIRHIRVQQNGSFFNVSVMVEQVQRDFLRRVGLSDEGALYKMDTNNLQSPTSGVEKRNRKDEDHSDLAALIDGLSLTGSAREKYVFDHINLPHEMCYLGGVVLNQHVSGTIRNYYMYRDTTGTGEWQSLPWDPDVSYGYFFSTGLTYHYATDRPNPISHPFIGGFDHPITYSSLADTVLPFRAVLYENPRTRQMLLRRLRTLMDAFLQEETLVPEGERHYEKRISELTALLAPDAALDQATWGASTMAGTEIPLATATQQIIDNYVSPRRTHLFVTHSVNNPGYTNSVLIPDAQPTNATVQFASLDFNPVSWNQDQEYIELVNTNTYSVDLSGWVITGGVTHVFTPGTVIPAFNPTNTLDHTLYLSPDVVAFRARTNSPSGGEGRYVLGAYEGHLSSFGETLVLRNTQGLEIDRLTYPGNPSQAQTDLVISEIMYHPPSGEEAEFIELLNSGTNTLSLSGVKFIEGIDFTFAQSLAPGDVTLLVRNRSAFEAVYGTGFQIAGEYLNATNAYLNNKGERIKLDDPTNSTIKDFTYGTQAPWPVAADGQGASLSLIDPGSNPDPDIAAHWRDSLQGGGTPGVVYAAARDEWMDVHFTAVEQGDASLSAWTADADGDHRSNDQEFLFGGDPRRAEATESMVILPDQSLRLLRRIDSPEVSYVLECSTDLETWVPAESLFSREVESSDSTSTYRYTPLQILEGPRYYRQRASY